MMQKYEEEEKISELEDRMVGKKLLKSRIEWKELIIVSETSGTMLNTKVF